MVQTEGFEPPTFCSQSRRSTRLTYVWMKLFLELGVELSLELSSLCLGVLNGLLDLSEVATSEESARDCAENETDGE